MFNIFLFVLCLAGTFCTLIGMLTVFYWIKKPRKPSDESNRLNNIASWWIGTTRPDVMANGYKFFRQDVVDNINDVEGD